MSIKEDEIIKEEMESHKAEGEDEGSEMVDA